MKSSFRNFLTPSKKKKTSSNKVSHNRSDDTAMDEDESPLLQEHRPPSTVNGKQRPASPHEKIYADARHAVSPQVRAAARVEAGNGPAVIHSNGTEEHALKLYKIAIEYEHLKEHSPSGIFILPGDSLRHFNGIIFLRNGLFANGIFEFEIELPPLYNDRGTFPLVRFNGPSQIPYHPLVHPQTGELDLRSSYPVWDPRQHFLVTVLLFVKKIFYLKEFDDYERILNTAALKMHTNNYSEYRKRCKLSIETKQNVLLDQRSSTNNRPSSKSLSGNNNTKSPFMGRQNFTIEHSQFLQLMKRNIKQKISNNVEMNPSSHEEQERNNNLPPRNPHDRNLNTPSVPSPVPTPKSLKASPLSKTKELSVEEVIAMIDQIQVKKNHKRNGIGRVSPTAYLFGSSSR